ncbi:MAG: OmpH family outer membrane protein [Bacteroidota bacterium]
MKRIFLLLSLVVILASCETEKTAYVDNTELVERYYKMKNAEEKFQLKNENLTKELDSFAKAFQQKVQTYQSEMNQLSTFEQEKEEEKLIEEQRKIQQMQQEKTKELERESKDVADDIIAEMRDKIAKYGEKNSYTYIFGSNETSNILYAKKGKDITIEVLNYLNKDKVD